MDCPQVAIKLSGLLDGQIVEQERHALETHLGSCAPCAGRWEEFRAVRAGIRALPARRLPSSLVWKLRITASREAARRRRGLLGGIVEEWAGRTLRLAADLMRPLAIPAAGGVFSAVLLFFAVMTNFSGVVLSDTKDVPTILNTEASMLSSMPVASDTEFVILEVLIDEQGRVVDYSIPASADPVRLANLRRQIEVALRFAQFKPATQFGQPVMGWVRVTFSGQRSEMDVRG
jgi:hypothetical protein